jgi:hypothetical protein
MCAARLHQQRPLECSPVFWGFGGKRLTALTAASKNTEWGLVVPLQSCALHTIPTASAGPGFRIVGCCWCACQQPAVEQARLRPGWRLVGGVAVACAMWAAVTWPVQRAGTRHASVQHNPAWSVVVGCFTVGSPGSGQACPWAARCGLGCLAVLPGRHWAPTLTRQGVWWCVRVSQRGWAGAKGGGRGGMGWVVGVYARQAHAGPAALFAGVRPSCVARCDLCFSRVPFAASCGCQLAQRTASMHPTSWHGVECCTAIQHRNGMRAPRGLEPAPVLEQGGGGCGQARPRCLRHHWGRHRGGCARHMLACACIRGEGWSTQLRYDWWQQEATGVATRRRSSRVQGNRWDPP